MGESVESESLPADGVGPNISWMTRAICDPASPRSISARLRERRWDELLRCFPDLERSRVIDLGGTSEFWHAAPVRPSELTIVNLTHQRAPWPGCRMVAGDACGSPPELAGERFDLAIANSVIGCVGGHARRVGLASAIRQVADSYWVQTPYRYFPLEPCFLFPAHQFLPLRVRSAVAIHWNQGHRHTSVRHDAVEMCLMHELLSKTEMRHYFPDSVIWGERVCGVTKSLVAIRRA